MKNLIITIVILFTFSSIFAQIKVEPVTSADLQIKKNTILYSLPRTVVSIRVTVETEYFFAGPFCKYADKYLTIDNAQTENSIQSEIYDVNFCHYSEPDPSATYLVFDKKNNFNIGYNSNGVIKSYGFSEFSESLSEPDNILNFPNYMMEDILFEDLSIKRNFTDITDTTYKVVEVDSVFHKIPIYNKTITSKEFEQKAEEAANFIVKLRKRKFKLMSGQFDTVEAPKDIKYMIEELEKLEQEYLSLFIGKSITVTNAFYFKYSPDANIKEEKIHLFNLSDEAGILPVDNVDGEPVYLIMKSNAVISETDRFYNRQTELKDKDKTKGLYYRIPGYGTATITFLDHVYAEQIFLIPQYGYINYLPAKMFKNKNLKILFDENSGFVKTITNE